MPNGIQTEGEAGRTVAHLLWAADRAARAAFREPIAARVAQHAVALEGTRRALLARAAVAVDSGDEAGATVLARRAYRLAAERRIVIRRAAEAVADGHRLVLGGLHGRAA